MKCDVGLGQSGQAGGARPGKPGILPTIAALVLIFAPSSIPVHGQAVSPHYHVRVQSNMRVAEVTVSLPVGASRLFMDSVQAQHLPNGWGTFLQDLTVRMAGDEVPVEPLGPTEWRLPAGYRGPLTVSYGVDLRFTERPWPAGNEQAGARFDDALYLVGRALFVDSDLPGSRRVTFELPPGWQASTPWRVVDSGDLTFEADGGTDLIRNSLVLGRHASVRVNVGSFDLELVLPGAMRAAAPLVEPALRSVLGSYLRMFPDTPPTRYLMTFFRAGADDGESFTRSAGFTTADSATSEGLIVWGNFLAHELFHFWNGQRIRGAAARTAWRWFAEGFTEYYANVTLAREGIISQELFLKKAERHLGNYLYFTSAPAFARVSLADAGRDTGVNRFAVYDGGWTVAFCLDGLIRERSGDRSSLDDVMRELWRTTRSGSPGYTVTELDALVDQFATAALGRFIATYVEETRVAPVGDCVRRVGLVGAFKGYAGEAFLFPDPAATTASVMRGRRLFGPLSTGEEIDSRPVVPGK